MINGIRNPVLLILCRLLGVKVVLTKSVEEGVWRGGKTIYLNPNRINNYTVLHELGHVICGNACCLEHCEFEAHGAAKALAKVCGIKVNWKMHDAEMGAYSGCSPRKVCKHAKKRRKK